MGATLTTIAERDAQYWLKLAEEARLQAEEMTHPPTRREMLQIATGYKRVAERAREQREQAERNARRPGTHSTSNRHQPPNDR